MSQPYVGEIRMFGGNFAPQGWMFCDGALLPISENETLFNLIGTTYGGDGQSTFGLPDLRGRVPVHMGTLPKGGVYEIGEAGGVENVTLGVNQIPVHTHPFVASTAGATATSPANQLIAQSGQRAVYTEDSTTTNLAPSAISPAGGSEPHTNIQPYLAINFIISLYGIFPSQN